MELKYLGLAMVVLSVFSSCKKEISGNTDNDHPVMRYTDVNLELKSWTLKGIDIDADGKKDFAFEAYPVGDPVMQQDKIQFYAYSTIHTSFLSDVNDNPPMLAKGETVKPVHMGYEWWPITASLLAQKITPATGPVFWDGIYKLASKKYLPFKMNKNSLDFFGWIEISIDQAGEKLIVHRTGLSTEAGKVVKAGF